MRKGAQKLLLEQVEESYKNAADYMEDIIDSFESLRSELESALEELEGDIDEMRDRLELCRNLSVLCSDEEVSVLPESLKTSSFHLIHADVPTAAYMVKMK